MTTEQTNKTLLENPGEGVRRSPFFRLLICAAVACLFFAILAFYFSTEPRFAWLSKAEFDSAIKGNLVVRAKRKLHFMNPGLWEWLFGRKPGVALKTLTTILPRGEIDDFFGPSMSTNANGVRAWILSANKAARFKTLLNATGNRISFSGEFSVPSGMTMHSGNGVMIQPYILGNSVKIVGRFPTNPALPPNVFCRVQAEAGEILLIADCTTSKADDKISVFILIPKIVDSTGRPLK